VRAATHQLARRSRLDSGSVGSQDVRCRPRSGRLYYWLREQEVIECKRGLLAVLDAETAEEAKARVRDNLPANGNGNYGIGDPESW
jgi:hypothetical protein